VKEVRWHGGICELALERESIDFIPGDCIALYAEDGVTSRPYSIASGTRERQLRLLVRHIEGGAVSDKVAHLRPGDLVKVSPPFGWFRPGTRAPFVFVSTGTGIAPFLSHLRTNPASPPLVLLHGVRRREEAGELQWLKEVCPDVRLAVSREQAPPGAHRGRVTDLLDQDLLSGSVTCHYYLCGLDAMISDVTEWLVERGVRRTQIHRECFFNAAPLAA
jgi:ferredoxin-NADP reductase